ncbi:DEAD/DEAH box helicase [Aerococcus sp. HMSC10H05]|uniref:DEAD/DEAH box helicase n=1 Tax=Aerococcus sp. HMSC10H05 TaxID=1581084 RepID=UPI0008A4716C|nr:DEAD/DEAH box helicase [Aerococcus sp. HMSC10H05]OFU53425.1 ATP-dependent RNA helicase [Aerococcus sp. HMSC10H05]
MTENDTQMTNFISRLPVVLQEKWQSAGFDQATDIQTDAFQPMYDAKSVIASAPTGSGKTLAYLLPILSRMVINREGEKQYNGGVKLIVLVPSQELASQVGDVVQDWARAVDFKALKIIGGANVKRQIEKIRERPDIIVGTSGRMIELIDQRKLKVHEVDTMIIDEADALLDQEHILQTKQLAKKLPGSAQVALFSATVPDTLTDLASDLLAEPVVALATKKIGAAFETQRRDGYITVPVRKRDDMLRRLAQIDGMQALVFVRTVAEIERLQQKLQFNHIQTAYLHSKMAAQNRQQAIKKFIKGEYTYLFTTDVAARGLDIDDLPLVIQYDLPATPEQYIHRAGRTGRMGKDGIVLTFVNDRSLRDLKKQVGDDIHLTAFYTYGGQLTDQVPSASQRDEDQPLLQKEKEDKLVKAKPKVKKAKKEHKSTPSVKARKKNRKRDHKNKGARRHKG